MLRANETEPAEEDRLIRPRATRPWKPHTALVALAPLAVVLTTAAGGTPTGSAGGSPNPVWLVLIGLGGLLVVLGGWLLFWPRRVARDDVAIAAVPAVDPCADLLAASDKAKVDCDEARMAATEASADHERRAAQERAARKRLGAATRARAKAEVERTAEADAALADARAAEANAQTGVERAAKVTAAAAAAAAEAEARATEICARVEGAEAAYRGCIDDGGKVKVETTGGHGAARDDTATKVRVRATPSATVGGGGVTQPRVCRDGAEEWRNEGKRQKFTVPVPGAKVQVMSEPSQTNLDAWLDEWRAVDADVHPLPAPTDNRGIPPTIFVRQAADRIRRLWEGLDGPVRQVVEVTIVLPLQRVEIQCQRLYRCENGAWARTGQKRLVEYDPVPSPKSHVLEGQVHTSSDVFGLWEKASRDWQKYVPNDEALERARTRCQHGD